MVAERSVVLVLPPPIPFRWTALRLVAIARDRSWKPARLTEIHHAQANVFTPVEP